jgi:hypothetical protein
VYDVVDDSYISLSWATPGLVLSALVIAIAVGILHVNKWRLSGYPSRSNPWFFLFIGSVVAIAFLYLPVNKALEQHCCKRWAASGDFQTLEGDITGKWNKKGYTHFRAADTDFAFRNDMSGGFSGKFTKPGVAPDLLQEGQHVRITYHEGQERRILRIEVPGP